MSLLPPRVQKSTYKGVEYITATGKYRSFVYSPRGLKVFIGLFDTELEAAIERDKYLLKNRCCELRRLNFPPPNYEI